MHPRRTLIAAALASPALLARPADAQRFEQLFAPRARLWERWTTHDANSTQRVDHGVWDGFLQRHRSMAGDGIARVNYSAVTATEKQALEGYLSSLVDAPVDRLSRPEQYAFWANLYNALTVRSVLLAYPVASIRDVSLSGGVLLRGPWDAHLATIGGEKLTLNDIEHRILRPIWHDPRTHYALNCAAIGCPNLAPRAFTAANTEMQVEAGARAYVNDPRGVKQQPDNGFRLSSIYNWFAEDFGGEGGVLRHVMHFATPELAAAIQRTPRISGYDYNWALNDAK